jgi:hypothetical protein
MPPSCISQGGCACAARARKTVTAPEEPTSTKDLGPGRPPSSQDSDDEGGNSVNGFAVLFVIVLVIGCVWLFTKLQQHNEIGNCIASGRRDCVQLDPSSVPTR